MGAVNVMGVNYTKSINPVSTNIMDPVQDAVVRCLSDEYTAASVEAGSTIKMGKKLPAGAIVVHVVLSHAALGGGSTLAVGDSTVTDRYLAAASSAADGVRDSGNLTIGQQYVIGTATDDDIIQILTAGATITGKIKLDVFYKCNGAA